MRGFFFFFFVCSGNRRNGRHRREDALPVPGKMYRHGSVRPEQQGGRLDGGFRGGGGGKRLLPRQGEGDAINCQYVVLSAFVLRIIQSCVFYSVLIVIAIRLGIMYSVLILIAICLGIMYSVLMLIAICLSIIMDPFETQGIVPVYGTSIYSLCTFCQRYRVSQNM